MARNTLGAPKPLLEASFGEYRVTVEEVRRTRRLRRAPTTRSDYWLLIDGSGVKLEESSLGLFGAIDISDDGDVWIVGGVLPGDAASIELFARQGEVRVYSGARAWLALAPGETLSVRLIAAEGHVAHERAGHPRMLGDSPAS